jgi:hypothetical protein
MRSKDKQVSIAGFSIFFEQLGQTDLQSLCDRIDIIDRDIALSGLDFGEIALHQPCRVRELLLGQALVAPDPAQIAPEDLSG